MGTLNDRSNKRSLDFTKKVYNFEPEHYKRNRDTILQMKSNPDPFRRTNHLSMEDSENKIQPTDLIFMHRLRGA